MLVRSWCAFMNASANDILEHQSTQPHRIITRLNYSGLTPEMSVKFAAHYA